MPSVFFSYCHADEAMRDQLEVQLSMLKRQGVISTWHDRRIEAGENFSAAIDEHVNQDEIILLLLSPDFLASDYCYNIEMTRALERHHANQAIVIPVILRVCDWRNTPLSKLLFTPRDARAITQWPDKDEAFLQVANEVRKAAEKLQSHQKMSPAHVPSQASAKHSRPFIDRSIGPRSSNLALTKTFSQLDKDRFQVDTFEYIARFFENSLSELQARNPGYEGVFRSIDSNRFQVAVYREGQAVARATIFADGQFGKGIYYRQGESLETNSWNEMLTVSADDQSLYMSSMGMSRFGQQKGKLSQEGAAEMLWELLLTHLQRR